MKHNSFILTCLFAIFMAMPVLADNPAGYTIFGPNKYGYEDLTSKVSVQAQGSVTYDSGVFKGAGLPGRICEGSNYLQLSFSAAQTMTLWNSDGKEYAIHIKLAKIGTPTGNVQISFCNGGWNNARVSYEIVNSDIKGDEIVLNFSQRKTGNYDSHNEGATYGENKSFSGEIFRICAASGESFEISQIYIKADETQTDPVDPSGDKDAPTNLQADVKSVAAVSAVITASAEDASAIKFNVYNGTDVIATATSTSGVEKDIEVKGLTPETEYTLSVEAVDAAGNVNPNKVNVTFTTLEQLEKRYYFVRSGDLPVIEKMTAVDLREATGTGSCVYKQMNLDNTKDYKHLNITSWWVYEHHTTSVDMSDVQQASWYLKMRVKTTNTTNPIHLALNSTSTTTCYNINTTTLPRDGEWYEIVLALKDHPGTLTYSATQSGAVFQWHGENTAGSYLGIDYMYLTNVPTNPEKPAIIDDDPPTDVSIAVKDASLSYDRLTLQLYAEDEDSPITYAVKYQVKNSGDTWTEVPTFTGAQGTTVEKEITGLTPETTYTFSVVASDPNGNEADAVTTEATTAKLAEKRYYFFRTGDLPANTSDLTCVDLREGENKSKIETPAAGAGITKITDTNFSKYLLSTAWCFVRVMPYAKTMDDVDGSWYLHIRYKSTHPQDVYANVAGHDQKSIKIATSADANNEWKVVNISLADYASKMTIPVAANADAFQIQAPNNATTPGTFAIDYAYISNSETSVDAGYVDGTAPVVTVEEKATTATAVTLTISGTDDSDSKIVYTFSDGTNSEEVTKNSGETFDYTFENLTKGTEYTFTVDAKDLSNNAMTQISKVITTPGGETKPVIQKFEEEATPTTIKLTFNATDEDTEHLLTYNISDGTNNYQVQEMQGVDVVYTLQGLTPGTEYNLTLTATNASENTSDPSELEVTTTYLKLSEFGVKIATVDMYNLNGHIAGNEKKSSIEYRVVTYKNYLLFQHKIVEESHGVSTGPWDNQMWVGESPLNDNQRDDYAAQYNPFGTQIRLTEEQIPFKQHTGSVEFDFDMYANIFGVPVATCSQMQHFVCGYINTPSEDTEAPSIFSVNYEDKDGKRYLTIDANDNNNATKDVFYYIKEGDNEYISLQTVVVPIKAEATYECYAIDWNGNMSAKQELTVSGIMISDEQDNSTVINQFKNQTVNVKLTRTLSNEYYNTLCLPFAMDESQVKEVFGEDVKLAKLDNARIKENEDLYLGFVFVKEIEAGVPYFIQPAQNVSNPSIEDVTISNTLQPTAIDGVVTFKGIINPTQLQAETEENHSILMLMANNELTFPNEAGKMNGMRAYFQTSGYVARIARRASFEVNERQMPTELEPIHRFTDSPIKLIKNGRFVIVKENKMYNAQGQKLQ